MSYEKYVTSGVDFYELLSLSENPTQKELDSRWRKFARLHHSDKVGDDAANAERFLLGKVAYEILSDPSSRALYDSTRQARQAKQRQNDLLKGKRKSLAEDLVAREKGFKRSRTEEENNEEKLARELRRLAGESQRLKREREEALKRESEKEAEVVVLPVESPSAQNSVSEIDRTILVRWLQEDSGESIGEDEITKVFSAFGTIDHARLLKPKDMRIGTKHKKLPTSRCMIQYASVLGAFTAIEDIHKQKGTEAFYVSWAGNKEPEFINGIQSSGTEAGFDPSTPAQNRPHANPTSFLNMNSNPVTPTPSTDGHNFRKMPSFSFSPATNMHKTSPLTKSQETNSPSLEEMTMIRLKNAEKKRLADEIRRQEEAAA